MPTKSRPFFARQYQRVSAAMDRAGVLEHRRALVAGLSGRVVEIGAGHGLNFAHYPRAVTELVAVEPEPNLHAAALVAARSAPVPVTVVDGVADDLPYEDGSFSAAVVSLVLCSVPDQARALAEIRRVLVAGGQLRFYEHVAAPAGSLLRGVQRFFDATLWPYVAGGCHTGRDTAAAIEAAGFVLDEVERFRFPERGPNPAAPHVRGRATRL